MTADDIRQARHDRVASALAEANAKTGLFKRPGTTAVADPYPEQQAALNDYWAAKTPEAEREAYTRMRELGLPAGYGEDDKPTGWQPIETAPKGRDQVLLIARYPTSKGWSDVYHSWRGIGPLGQHIWVRWPHPFEPTHWMPLPEPPEEPGA